MNFRDQLARVIARDARYPIEAYAFLLESLKLARSRKLKELRQKAARPGKPRGRPGQRPRREEPAEGESGHVSGQEICHAARRLAVRTYGAMAIMVLHQWGIRSTSDLGEIVYNLIASGELTKTPEDQRSDFEGVFDFEEALRPKSFPGKESST
ncbi:MAG: Minf_1886 family protein [Isosphaeraceae bacterium]